MSWTHGGMPAAIFALLSCVTHPALFPEPLSPRLCLLHQPLRQPGLVCVKTPGPPFVLIYNFLGNISLPILIEATRPWPQLLHSCPEDCPCFTEEVTVAQAAQGLLQSLTACRMQSWDLHSGLCDSQSSAGGKEGGWSPPFNELSDAFHLASPGKRWWVSQMAGPWRTPPYPSLPTPPHTEARGSLRAREGGRGVAPVMDNVCVTGVTKSRVALDEPVRGSV